MRSKPIEHAPNPFMRPARRERGQRRPTIVRALVRPLVFALGLSIASPAASAAPAKEAAARVQKARAAMSKKAWGDAYKELVAAWELSPEPTTAYLAGRAAEEMGSHPEAAEWYRRAIDTGKLPASESLDAKTRLAALEKRPVKVEIDSTPEGATVHVDGKEVEQKTPFFIHLAPGTHQILYELGTTRVTREVEIAPLKSATVQIDLGAAPTAKEPEKPKEPEQPKETALPSAPEDAPGKTTSVTSVTSATSVTSTTPVTPATTMRIVPPARRAAWITAGAAVVALGFGASYGLNALRDQRRYDDFPTDERKRLGDRDALVADVSLGLGVGLAIGSAILFWQSSPYEYVTLAPSVSKTTAGATFAWSF